MEITKELLLNPKISLFLKVKIILFAPVKKVPMSHFVMAAINNKEYIMITIFVASLNENMKLAQTLQTQLKALDQKSQIINLVKLQLPMYDSYKEEHDGIPPKINELIQTMENSSGYIFVSPEYNFSIPPVLSNTVAWISRVGDDFRKVFTLKTIQLATHSGGGGNDVTNAMRTQFTKLGSLVMPREIITTYSNPLDENSSERILQQFILLLNKEK